MGRTGKQKQNCCYGVGFESTLYVSRYQACVGKVCAVVIHPTSQAQVTFLCAVFDLEYNVLREIVTVRSNKPGKTSQNQGISFKMRHTVVHWYLCIRKIKC